MGMPASDTKTTRAPAPAASTMPADFSASLWSCRATRRPPSLMPRREARASARRVSSAATMSAPSRALTRRAEASRTSPMGVAASTMEPTGWR